jgi:hypothetical protein
MIRGGYVMRTDQRLPRLLISLIIVLLYTFGCTSPAEQPATEIPAAIPQESEPAQWPQAQEDTTSEESTFFLDPEALSLESHDEVLVEEYLAHLLYPKDLLYLGAFRLPEGSGGSNWEYSGYAMTYYPEGDPNGLRDGFPGSLYALGHDHQQFVSEISIPVPILSEAKDVGDLNTALTLQPFGDISGGFFGELEIPRAGLAYLPPQADQDSGKLYFCWGQHFQFEQVPSHGWSELDLQNPESVGPWSIADFPNYVTNDFLFEIPLEWAEIHTPGLRLVTGRFRDGTWGGLGPALLAIGPWNDGNPPASGATLLSVTPLLMYGEPIPGSPELAIQTDYRMVTYKAADEWSGGAWLTSGERSAVVLVGTKALGVNWYGFANGVRYPIIDEPGQEYPEVPPWPNDDRGYWSESISAQILFFDPEELAAVARGDMQPWEPQPYASLSIDEVLFEPEMHVERYKRYLLGAAAFDRKRGHLYIIERNADEERSLIHVFKILQ